MCPTTTLLFHLAACRTLCFRRDPLTLTISNSKLTQAHQMEHKDTPRQNSLFVPVREYHPSSSANFGPASCMGWLNRRSPLAVQVRGEIRLSLGTYISSTTADQKTLPITKLPNQAIALWPPGGRGSLANRGRPTHVTTSAKLSSGVNEVYDEGRKVGSDLFALCT